MLDQRGMLSTFMSVGIPVDAAHFAGIPIDMSTLPTRYSPPKPRPSSHRTNSSRSFRA